MTKSNLSTGSYKDETRRGGQAPIWLLVLLQLFLAAAVVCGGQRLGPALVFALIGSQASLLGMWFALAPNPRLVKTSATAGGVVVLTVVLCRGLGENDLEWFFATSAITGLTALAVSLLRVLGLRVSRPGGGPPRNSRWYLQFSLRVLLGAMLAVAVFAAALRHYGLPTGAADLATIVFALAIGCGLASVAVILVWSALSPYDVALRTLVAAAVSLLTAWIAFSGMEATHIDPGGLWFQIVLMYTVTTWCSLMIVRAAGYRITPVSHALVRKDAVGPVKSGRGVSDGNI
ncbi:MAG: hypothetical protein QGG36_29070 [Pirellulaceae bacterium]|jgi:hypothetical protein|nr:hypothetical protein [Pirellulaceae bacterium]MDP7019885.1 hypothetical protein [Pirellulaceae bacterium]